MAPTVSGKVVRFGSMEFFVDHGLIRCVDNRDTATGRGSETVLTPDELRERLQVLGYALQRRRGCEQSNIERDESPRKLTVFNRLEQLADDADAAGSPADPAFQAFFRRHRPGRKATVTLSAGADAARYPTLSPMPLGPFTGRTAVADSSRAVAPSTARLMQPYEPARRKSALILPGQ